jgi:hypothetical protein
MSATENYVLGKEADEFFKSITLAPYRNNTAWINFQPSAGGFSVQLPHKPYIRDEADGDWTFAANDNTVNYLILKRSIFEDDKLLKDTLNLALAEESFTGKEKGLKTLERKLGEKNNASTLDALYQTADTSFLKVHYVLNGPHYYLLAAKGKNKNEVVTSKAFTSFELTPFVYAKAQSFSDSLLNFETQTPVMPHMNDSLKSLMHQYGKRSRYGYDSNDDGESYEKYGKSISMVFTNDTTGEIITVTSSTQARYFFENDS